MITRVTIIVLALIVTFVHCGPGGNKKSQALEQEVTSLRENLTALWEVVGQIRMQLERMEQEEPRVHHHHYHHRYYMVSNNGSLDDVNGTSDPEDLAEHEVAFAQMLLPAGEHHQHHHHVHHHHPKDVNYTEQNGPPKCNGNHNGLNSNGGPDEEDSEEVLAKAICHVRPNRALPLNERQNVRGTVHFRQKATQLTIYINLRGFLITPATHTQPNLDHLENEANRHGLHVHEFGDLSNGCESAGDHYNPYKREEGSSVSNKKHVGDFGNITCDNQGKLDVRLIDTSASLLGTYSIIGKTLVIHENPDVLETNSENGSSSSNGNAGRRLACCVITKQGD